MEDPTAVDPQPAPAPALGSQSGYKSSPKGRREAANKAAVKPGIRATLPPGGGRGPGAASGCSPGGSVPTAHLRAGYLRRQLRVPPESQRLSGSVLRAVLAPQPLTQPPKLGETNPGGKGGPGPLEGLNPAAWPVSAPSAGRCEKGDWRGIWAARLLLVEVNRNVPEKLRESLSSPLPRHPSAVPHFAYCIYLG